MIAGEAPPQLSAVQDLMLQTVELARPERSGEDRAVGRTGIDTPGEMEQPLSRLLLQLAPQLIRPLEQRDVAGMFSVGQPDDAGESVGGSVLVQQIEALQAQYLESPSGEMVERGAPHPAETHDDDVVGDQKL